MEIFTYIETIVDQLYGETKNITKLRYNDVYRSTIWETKNITKLRYNDVYRSTIWEN